MRKTSLLTILCVVVGLLISAAIVPPITSAQFIDRIVRPCTAGIVIQASVIVNPNNTGNVDVTPCTGGSLTVNGTAVIPGGVTCTGCTVGILPYFSAANTLANSPITRTSASAVRVTTMQLGSASSLTGSLILANSGSALLTTIQAGNATAARTYAWPTNFGNAGDALTDPAGNGVLAWAAAVGGSGTAGTLPYFATATSLGDSPITRLSATHLQLFANAGGGADFDSSTPAITLNGTGATVNVGNTSGTLLTVNDAATSISLTAAATATINSPAIDFPDAAYRNCVTLGTDGAGLITCAISDARLKNIGGRFDFGLESVRSITPRLFKWKDGRREGIQAGLIAQDVQHAIPLAVSTNGARNLQIEQGAVNAALINSIKELAARVEELERETGRRGDRAMGSKKRR